MTTSTEETKSTQTKGREKGPKTPKKADSDARRAPVAPAKAKWGKKASPAKKTFTAQTGAKAGTARDGSKKAEVLDLLRREQGATLAEIMKAAKWQAHSVRGFISTATKKYGLKIESAKTDAGERVYKLSN